MRNLRNKNAPPLAGLVQEFIDSAYDTVKLVADNLGVIIEVGDAIDAGTFENLVYIQDIDTFVELNAMVTDAELATEAYVDQAVTGLYEFMGGYDASLNVPDLTTSPNSFEVAQSWQVTVAGTFFGANVEPGDQLTAIIDNPAVEADWSIVNRNIDSAAFATATQGATADSALQPGNVDNISELINDSGYTNDQTDSEIVIGYNNIVEVVSQIEAEAGVNTTVRRWTAQRVAQAAKAQTGAIVFVIDDYVALPSQMVFVNSSVKAISVTLPAGADKNNVWIIDAGHNASINNITILPDGTDNIDSSASFILDQNDNFCNAAFDAGTTNWQLAISGVPDLIEQAPHTHTISDITDLAAGFPAINTQTGLTYTFVDSDLVNGVTAANLADSTYSIPDGLGNPGDLINIYNKRDIGTNGEVTIAMLGTDTLDSINNNCIPGNALTIEKIAATVWAVIGGTSAP